MKMDFKHKTYDQWSKEDPETLLRFMAVFAKVENRRCSERSDPMPTSNVKERPRSNSIRTRILADVQAHPNATEHSRAARLNAAATSVAGTLYEMRSEGYISRTRSGRHLLTKAGEARLALSREQVDKTQLVLEDIHKHPIDQLTDRAERLGIIRSTVSWCIQSSKKRGEIVTGDRQAGFGGSKNMFLTNKGRKRMQGVLQ